MTALDSSRSPAQGSRFRGVRCTGRERVVSSAATDGCSQHLDAVIPGGRLERLCRRRFAGTCRRDRRGQLRRLSREEYANTIIDIFGGHLGSYPQLVELVAVLDAPPGKPAVLETEIYLGSGDINDKPPVGDSIRLVPFGLGMPVPKGHQAKVAADKGLPGLAVRWIELQPLNVPSVGDRWLTADFPPEFDKELGQIRASRPEYPPVPVATRNSVKPDEFLAIMEKTIRRITPRFFRRDLSTDELAATMAVIKADVEADVEAGRCVSEIVVDQVRNLLTSPDFFCIVEEPGPLSDFARLSSFLRNSPPDEQLLDLARKNKLHDSVVLREPTDRMLADPKAKRFCKDFAAQWPRLAAISDTTPDPKLFPESHLPENDLLKWSSVAETEAFLKLLVDENASVKEIVDSRRVLANAVLARHLGNAKAGGGTELVTSHGGRIAVTGGVYSVSASNKPQLIGNIGTGALAVSGSSKVDIHGPVRIGNGAEGRGEVVLDTSEPISSIRQEDVQHGRLAIGKNAVRLFCNAGTPKGGHRPRRHGRCPCRVRQTRRLRPRGRSQPGRKNLHGGRPHGHRQLARRRHDHQSAKRHGRDHECRQLPLPRRGRWQRVSLRRPRLRECRGRPVPLAGRCRARCSPSSGSPCRPTAPAGCRWRSAAGTSVRRSRA
jgi:hypothetical protein